MNHPIIVIDKLWKKAAFPKTAAELAQYMRGRKASEYVIVVNESAVVKADKEEELQKLVDDLLSQPTTTPVGWGYAQDIKNQ